MFCQMIRSTEVNSSLPPIVPLENLTVSLPVELVTRIRDAARAMPGLTLSDFIEEFLREAVDWLERENGGAFETR